MAGLIRGNVTPDVTPFQRPPDALQAPIGGERIPPRGVPKGPECPRGRSGATFRLFALCMGGELAGHAFSPALGAMRERSKQAPLAGFPTLNSVAGVTQVHESRWCLRCQLPVPASRGKKAKYCSLYCQQHRYTSDPKPTPTYATCLRCGAEFAKKRPDSRFCSRDCSQRHRDSMRSQENLAAKELSIRKCPVCNVALPPSFRADRRYCSDSCAHRARGHVGNASRRLRVPDLPMPITRIEVYERDKWKCQLCFKPVNPDLQYPDPRSPSLDHVIPLSRGGRHDSTNLQLAHLQCNVSARDIKVDQIPRPPVVLRGEKFFRIPEAADLIGTTYYALDKAIREGRVTAHREGRWRYLPVAQVAAMRATGFLTARELRVQAVRERRILRKTSRCTECGV